jgi:hypothetical protein
MICCPDEPDVRPRSDIQGSAGDETGDYDYRCKQLETPAGW